MIYISLRNTDIEKESGLINLVADSLNSGQVAALPTDTIYGFSCRADNRSAVRRIYELKQRSLKEPLLVLVSSLAMLKKYAKLTPVQLKEMNKMRKGKRATTFILPSRGLLAKELTSPSGGLAVRLPKRDFLIKIIRKAGYPLVSTSLNISKRPALDDLSLIRDYFPDKKRQPDLVLDNGICTNSLSSQLVDLRDPEHPKVLRK